METDEVWGTFHYGHRPAHPFQRVDFEGPGAKYKVLRYSSIILPESVLCFNTTMCIVYLLYGREFA